MNLLAIDAACSVLSIAVSRGEEILYSETEAGMKHSELVMDIINTQMEKAGLKPGDLNGILCMGGPGSFTGLRIGFSIAKGLALSLSIPFVPVPTLDCIAYSAAAGLVIPVIQARKDAFFFTLFRDGSRIMEDADGTVNQIVNVIREKTSEKEKIIITGPAAQLLYNALPDEQRISCECSCKNMGYARELIYIAQSKNLFYNDNTVFLYSGPEYIRKTDAEINLLRN
ncbi:MAG: tRNA (adenosine(37)-N6)-threonylcarbamoyltransferase complex dimerization subunit type 1 TsaB [Treponema sp.]|jgi:tRNA threonylcarbamoyladenosine biosynthesis protein TsaB|nr:tRNA (adenosine(37)-N6)-threonylcarbamoyltransferase complex dimerization subunit type 1 TsaB [Treponema sp.]